MNQFTFGLQLIVTWWAGANEKNIEQGEMRRKVEPCWGTYGLLWRVPVWSSWAYTEGQKPVSALGRALHCCCWWARLQRRWNGHFWMWWDASHASLEPLLMPLNCLGGHSILFQYPWMLLITLWDSPDYSRSTNHHPFKPPTELSKSLFIILHFILIQESDLIITK